MIDLDLLQAMLPLNRRRMVAAPRRAVAPLQEAVVLRAARTDGVV